MDENRLREILSDELKKRGRVDCEEHHNQHEFLGAWIKKEERKQEMFVKIKTQVLGWSIVVALGWVGKTVAAKFGIVF